MAKNILIADDSPNIRTMLKAAFAQVGWNTVEATNGIEGLAKAQEHNFDCIITDLKMPQMDGLEFISELRKLPNVGNTCPIIVYSSITQDYVITEVLKAGATKLVHKDETTPAQIIQLVTSLTN